jgi:hypothetical protein
MERHGSDVQRMPFECYKLKIINQFDIGIVGGIITGVDEALAMS